MQVGWGSLAGSSADPAGTRVDPLSSAGHLLTSAHLQDQYFQQKSPHCRYTTMSHFVFPLTDDLFYKYICWRRKGCPKDCVFYLWDMQSTFIFSFYLRNCMLIPYIQIDFVQVDNEKSSGKLHNGTRDPGLISVYKLVYYFILLKRLFLFFITRKTSKYIKLSASLNFLLGEEERRGQGEIISLAASVNCMG